MIYKLLKYLAIAALSLVLLLALLFVILGTITNSSRFDAIAKNILNTHIDGVMEFDSLRINMFRDFPSFHVTASNGMARSGVADIKSDTLATLDKLDVKINLFYLLSDFELHISEAKITNGKAQVYIEADKTNSWSMFRFKKQSKEKDPHKKKHHKKIKLYINNVTLAQGADFTYSNQHKEMFLHASTDSLRLFGEVAIDWEKLNATHLYMHGAEFDLKLPKEKTFVNCMIDSLKIDQPGHQPGVHTISLSTENDIILLNNELIINKIAINLDGKIKTDSIYHHFDIEKLNLRINKDIDLSLQGKMHKLNGDKGQLVDLNYTADIGSIQSVFKLLPSKLQKWNDKIRPTCTLSLMGSITDTLIPQKHIYPVLQGSILIKNGSLNKPYNQPSITNLNSTIRYALNLQDKEASNLYIEQLGFEMLNSSVLARGYINKILNNPTVDLYINSRVNLMSLAKLVGHQKANLIKGNASLNTQIKLETKTNDHHKLSALNVIAQTSIPSFTTYLDKDTFKVSATTFDLKLAANNSTRNKNTLDGSLLIKPISVQRNSFETMAINGLQLFSKGFFLKETQIGQLYTDFSFGEIRLKDKLQHDSITNKINGTSGYFNFSQENDNIKTISTAIKTNPSQLHLPGLNLQTEKAYFTLEGDYKPKIDTMNLNGFQRFVNNWNLSGALLLEKTKPNSPFLLLDNTVEKVEILYTPNNVELKEFNLKSGASDLLVSGAIGGLVDSIVQNKPLSMKLNISSDTINLNQIVPAIAKGVLTLQEYPNESVDSIVGMIFPPKLMPIGKDTTKKLNQLILIPKNLSLNVDINTHNVLYENLLIDSFIGNILVMNETLQLDNFRISSNDGNYTLNGMYDTKLGTHAYTAIGIDIQKFNIGKLITIVPDLKHLVPILQNLDGDIHCKVEAVATIDSTMYINMPSIYGTCILNGTNMSLNTKDLIPRFVDLILFHGDQTLKTDSVSIRMVAKNGMLHVYPFLLDIEKYKVGITGYQQMNDELFYHFSVLHSFIPFKFGFNISGRPHHLHFRLTKAKLNDNNVFESTVATDQLNLGLGQNLREAIEQRAVKIEQAELLKAEAIDSTIHTDNDLPEWQRKLILDQLSKFQKSK
ncbi:MAG: AsmA-like C-terminal region-containing protein [Tannerellaceae bacterium]